MIRAFAHWLTTQARNLTLDALGIRSEVEFVRTNRRELEEFRQLRDDLSAAETLDSLFPLIQSSEFAHCANTVDVEARTEDARTVRAWPPRLYPEDAVTKPAVGELETRKINRVHRGDFV